MPACGILTLRRRPGLPGRSTLVKKKCLRASAQYQPARPRPAPRKFTCFGPFWCVSNAVGDQLLHRPRPVTQFAESAVEYQTCCNAAAHTYDAVDACHAEHYQLRKSRRCLVTLPYFARLVYIYPRLSYPAAVLMLRATEGHRFLQSHATPPLPLPTKLSSRHHSRGPSTLTLGWH